ncbi:MAG: TIGR03905 family TSCPD domain-containing protein [Lachnospiraceae bacterium]|nr:TIGR03905 family TSCPD domain-containing protein [Lachnospiraceae bacterium]
MHYSPKGICAVGIDFDVNDDRVSNIKFTGGCDGNHKGIVALCEGMLVDEVITRLDGITCGMRNSSCPDQLAKALTAYKNNAL